MTSEYAAFAWRYRARSRRVPSALWPVARFASRAGVQTYDVRSIPSGTKSVRRAYVSIGSPVTFSTNRWSANIASPEYPNREPGAASTGSGPSRSSPPLRQFGRPDVCERTIRGVIRRRSGWTGSVPGVRKRRVEVERPSFYELQDGRGEDGLRHRGGLEERRVRDGRLRPCVGDAPYRLSTRPSGRGRRRSTRPGRGARASGAARASRSSRASPPTTGRGASPPGRAARARARRRAARPRPGREGTRGGRRGRPPSESPAAPRAFAAHQRTYASVSDERADERRRRGTGRGAELSERDRGACPDRLGLRVERLREGGHALLPDPRERRRRRRPRRTRPRRRASRRARRPRRDRRSRARPRRARGPPGRRPRGPRGFLRRMFRPRGRPETRERRRRGERRDSRSAKISCVLLREVDGEEDRQAARVEEDDGDVRVEGCPTRASAKSPAIALPV